MKLKQICALLCAMIFINSTALSAENNSSYKVKTEYARRKKSGG